jgi:hypothetical protein
MKRDNDNDNKKSIYNSNKKHIIDYDKYKEIKLFTNKVGDYILDINGRKLVVIENFQGVILNCEDSSGKKVAIYKFSDIERKLTPEEIEEFNIERDANKYNL